MVAKSNIEKLPEPVKKRLNELIRAGQHTLREMVSLLEAEFPNEANLPSKSAVQRYTGTIKEVIAREREFRVLSESVIGELGKDFDTKSGQLLTQLLTTLLNRTALSAYESENIEISDVLDLARAVKATNEAGALNHKTRRMVEDEARRKLLEEQAEKLKAMGNKGGVTDDAKRAIREALGITV